MIASGLPPVTFISGAQFEAFPLAIANNTTEVLPGARALDVSGYNTLSLFVTVDLVAGNTVTVTLATVDPQTGAQVGGNLGDLLLVSTAADGSFATTVYLPAYYATLTGLVLPFYQVQFNLRNAGVAGAASVTAFKLWLSNA